MHKIKKHPKLLGVLIKIELKKNINRFQYKLKRSFKTNEQNSYKINMQKKHF